MDLVLKLVNYSSLFYISLSSWDNSLVLTYLYPLPFGSVYDDWARDWENQEDDLN